MVKDLQARIMRILEFNTFEHLMLDALQTKNNELSKVNRALKSSQAGNEGVYSFSDQI